MFLLSDLIGSRILGWLVRMLQGTEIEEIGGQFMENICLSPFQKALEIMAVSQSGQKLASVYEW